MNISVRLEGGLGDCLLGNRFVAAIKEKYPQASITAYIDSEGKTFQKEALESLYPSMYKEIKIIQSKKYKEFWIDCQFGADNYHGGLENVPDDILSEMKSYDKFYDLHIDSLKWLDYDFDWLRYFKYFPRPEITNNSSEDYIVCHLASAASVGHRLDISYLKTLLTKLHDTITQNIYLISTVETNHFYDSVSHLSRMKIFNGSIKDVSSLISNAKMMISTDSGFRYIAYGYSIPTITYSQQSPHPCFALPSHQLRWLMFPETCFPLNFDADFICDLTHKIIHNNGYILLPYLQNFDLQAVRRVYTINKEKTLLK
jgi:ADP-heptose:LPS heptosyltransferase